ncbi:MAG: hypothetical protein ACE15E_14110 [Acidobacteriota bacterium]
MGRLSRVRRPSEERAPVLLPLNEELRLYLLGDESVLFSKRSAQLYGLDRNATRALLRIAEGHMPGEVRARLEAAGRPGELVEQLSGLLAGDEPGGESCQRRYHTELPCPRWPVTEPKAPVRYQLLDTILVVQAPEPFSSACITPYVAHLACSGRERLDLVASIRENAGGWQLTLNGARQGGPLSPEQLIPLFYDRLRRFSYQTRPYLLAIHGSILERAGRASLIVGRSGSGKSTLAAALLARGYILVSDEPAVVDLSGDRVLAMPLGLGLKAGSWPTVAQDYPGFDLAPTHIRFDGRQVRYLLPDLIRVAPNGERIAAAQVLFPRYVPGVGGHCRRLSPVAALRAIVNSGYQVPDLEEERVNRIIAWLADLSCYSLTYSSTAEALSFLTSIGHSVQGRERRAASGAARPAGGLE